MTTPEQTQPSKNTPHPPYHGYVPMYKRWLVLAAIIILVGSIVFLAVSTSDPNKKKTMGSRASEIEENTTGSGWEEEDTDIEGSELADVAAPQNSGGERIFQSFMAMDGQTVYQRSCDSFAGSDTNSQDGENCTPLVEAQISQIFTSAGFPMPQKYRSFSILDIGNNTISEAALAEDGSTIYVQNCPYRVENGDITIDHTQCTPVTLFTLQRSYVSFDRYLYKNPSDGQIKVHTLFLREEDPTKTVSMICDLVSGTATPGLCRDNSTDFPGYTSVPYEQSIDPGEMGINDPAEQATGYSVLLSGGSSLGEATEATLAVITTSGSDIYYRFCPWDARSASITNTDCRNTQFNIFGNGLDVPSIKSFSRFAYYGGEGTGSSPEIGITPQQGAPTSTPSNIPENGTDPTSMPEFDLPDDFDDTLPVGESEDSGTSANSEEDTPMIGMSNPASVYCEENGGIVETEEDPSGGQIGICVLPDGTRIEQWEYYQSQDETNTAPPPRE